METREPRIVYSVVATQPLAEPERFVVREQAAERAEALAKELGVAVEIHELGLDDGRAVRRMVVYTAYP